MSIDKKDIVQMLERIATYLELKGENPFRISAYRRAAQGVERDVRSLEEIEDFTTVPGIGKGTNELILEIKETGSCQILQQLEEEIPPGLIPLLQVPGLGGKRLSVLYQELDIVDAESLEKACLEGKIEKIKGFGKKTVENILAGLKQLNTRPERLPIAYMLQLAEEIETFLDQIPEISKFSLAGSLRRLKETIKDIDCIIETDEVEVVKQSLMNMERVKDIIAAGNTKVSLTLDDEYRVNVDFRLVSKQQYATTLHHFTGSKEHNVAMRQLAKKRNEKINEYGVVDEETGITSHFTSEEAFFKHFNLHYIPPEMRENNTEIELFTDEVDIIKSSHIKGDLHMHTTWSDGANSLEEMVQAAK